MRRSSRFFLALSFYEDAEDLLSEAGSSATLLFYYERTDCSPLFPTASFCYEEDSSVAAEVEEAPPALYLFNSTVEGCYIYLN